MQTPRIALTAALLSAVLALPLAAAQAATSPGRAADASARAVQVKPRSDAWEAKVLKLTNARRNAHGVKPLKARRCPDRFAETWTRHMARTQDFSHQSLDPFFRGPHACPNISTAGENIAYGYETPRKLVYAWMHSAGHRANILNPAFHRIGIAGWARVSGGHRTTYATQDFVG
jgi:uncharacterized protein YkwD